MYVRKANSMRPILNSSRTEKAIRNEIQKTGRRIVVLCEQIDDLRASCDYYHYYGLICDLVETEDKIQCKIGKLMKQINRRNKLGRELNEKIHKAG